MNKIKHTASFEIDQPVSELFSLFSPEGEKLWVPGWDYENIMGSTALHEDYVFLTSSHDHASSHAIWIIKKYEPVEYLIQFYRVEPHEKFGVIEVICIPVNESRTEVQVSYEYLSLSEKGNHFIAGFSASHYQHFISDWESLLVKYFDQPRE